MTTCWPVRHTELQCERSLRGIRQWPLRGSTDGAALNRAPAHSCLRPGPRQLQNLEEPSGSLNWPQGYVGPAGKRVEDPTTENVSSNLRAAGRWRHRSVNACTKSTCSCDGGGQQCMQWILVLLGYSVLTGRVHTDPTGPATAPWTVQNQCSQFIHGASGRLPTAELVSGHKTWAGRTMNKAGSDSTESI